MTKLTKNQAVLNVDVAAKIDLEIKKMNKELKELKAGLKDYTVRHNILEVNGKDFVFKITSCNNTNVESQDLYDSIENGVIDLDTFLSLVKVNIKETKKELSNSDFESISSNFFDAYARVGFKAIKK